MRDDSSRYSRDTARWLAHLAAKDEAAANRSREARELEARTNRLIEIWKAWLTEIEVRFGARWWER